MLLKFAEKEQFLAHQCFKSERCSITRQKKATITTGFGVYVASHLGFETASFDFETATIVQVTERIPYYQVLACYFAERHRTL